MGKYNYLIMGWRGKKNYLAIDWKGEWNYLDMGWTELFRGREFDKLFSSHEISRNYDLKP